jgi:hypothetical protein
VAADADTVDVQFAEGTTTLGTPAAADHIDDIAVAGNAGCGRAIGAGAAPVTMMARPAKRSG